MTDADQPTPEIDRPTPEVEVPTGGTDAQSYGRLPAGPVETGQTESGPEADKYGLSEWQPTTAEDVTPIDDARLAPWALFAAIVALATSMFVGWGIPVALISVMAAIMSLRRPIENRSVAIWALVLGLCATLFSAGWLIWAATQFDTVG